MIWEKLSVMLGWSMLFECGKLKNDDLICNVINKIEIVNFFFLVFILSIINLIQLVI